MPQTSVGQEMPIIGTEVDLEDPAAARGKRGSDDEARDWACSRQADSVMLAGRKNCGPMRLGGHPSRYGPHPTRSSS